MPGMAKVLDLNPGKTCFFKLNNTLKKTSNRLCDNCLST